MLRCLRFVFFGVLLACFPVAATWGQDSISFDFRKQDSQCDSGLRGLSVVDEKTAWATGSGGTILLTVDGESWNRTSLPGRSEVEIRDVVAWDAQHALVMIAGQPAEFWETWDGARSWQRVFVDARPTAFFDDLLIDRQSGTGLAFGDVVEQAIPLVRRAASGHWYLLEDLADLSGMPDIHGYAASGTSMVKTSEGRFLIGTGGRLPDDADDRSVVLRSNPGDFRRWNLVRCPIPASESAGIFSLAVGGERLVAVGGDYKQPELSDATAAYSQDGGASWMPAQKMPGGFRSGVTAINTLRLDPVFVSVGTNGSDYSLDGGVTWHALNSLDLNAIQFVPNGKVGWAVGGKGRVFRVTANIR